MGQNCEKELFLTDDILTVLEMFGKDIPAVSPPPNPNVEETTKVSLVSATTPIHLPDEEVLKNNDAAPSKAALGSDYAEESSVNFLRFCSLIFHFFPLLSSS